ncbi:FMN-binding protein [Brevibacterium sp. JNUCC-42]|nr:FMN-binding protein [Brevibacterium sp. JNUCC-42]
MKKLSLIMASVLTVSMLAGCGAATQPTPEKKAETATSAEATDKKMSDGVYYAQQKNADADWNYAVVLDVKDGKITNVNWTGISKDAGPDKKTLSKDGKYGMKEQAKAQAEWHEQAEKVEKFLIEKQDPAAITIDNDGKTDAVSGVSIKVNDFASLVTEALAAGPQQAGPYKDGGYHAEQPEFEKDWKYTADFTVLNGKIVAANWNAINEKGEADKKTQSKEGKYAMVEKAKAQAEWHEQAAIVEQALIEKQDPAAITVNNEGKTDAVSGVSIKVNDFVKLAEEALKDAKK